MVVSEEIKDVAAMGLQDLKFQFGPLITLLDCTRFAFNWRERRPLLMGQIQDADLVLRSRSDLVDQAALDECAAELKEVGMEASPISVPRNRGLKKVAQTIDAFESTKAPRGRGG